MRSSILIRIVTLVLCFAPLVGAAQDSGEIRFQIAAVPGAERYLAFLEHPGYLAVALENNDLNPSLSSKLAVRDRGREVEARIAVFRYTGRKGPLYQYEAGLAISIGTARSTLTFPVLVDVSALAAGKVSVIVKPPLAALLPSDLSDRIQVKMRLVANAAAQQKVVGYLDRLAKGVPADAESAGLFEAVLLDAYNRSGGPAGSAHDVGDAVPLSEQWMLILTLLVWIVAVPTIYIVRWRRARRKPV